MTRNHPDHIWQNVLPDNIRKLVFHEVKRDGITSLHGIHAQLKPPLTDKKHQWRSLWRWSGGGEE